MSLVGHPPSTAARERAAYRRRQMLALPLIAVTDWVTLRAARRQAGR